jgi:hypothetical protein
VHAADVDGDGDLDVLSASAHDDKIAWYENRKGGFKKTGGLQTSPETHTTAPPPLPPPPGPIGQPRPLVAAAADERLVPSLTAGRASDTIESPTAPSWLVTAPLLGLPAPTRVFISVPSHAKDRASRNARDTDPARLHAAETIRTEAPPQTVHEPARVRNLKRIAPEAGVFGDLMVSPNTGPET